MCLKRSSAAAAGGSGQRRPVRSFPRSTPASHRLSNSIHPRVRTRPFDAGPRMTTPFCRSKILFRCHTRVHVLFRRDGCFSTSICSDENTSVLQLLETGLEDSTEGGCKKLTVMLRLPDNNPERLCEQRRTATFEGYSLFSRMQPSGMSILCPSFATTESGVTIGRRLG